MTPTFGAAEYEEVCAGATERAYLEASKNNAGLYRRAEPGSGVAVWKLLQSIQCTEFHLQAKSFTET